MIINIIMLICMYPVLPIMYFMLKNESKAKKNIVLGVTLPYEARDTDEVTRINKKFQKSLGIVCGIFGIIPFTFFLVPYDSIVVTLYLLWLAVIIIVPYIIYIKYHKKLKTLKKENRWGINSEASTTIDTKVASIPVKKLSKWLFIIPTIISFLPLIDTFLYKMGEDDSGILFIIFGTNALLTASFIFFDRIIYRQKSEIVGEDSDINITLTRVRRYNWSKSFIYMSWLTGLFSLFFWIFFAKPYYLLIMSGIYSVVLLCLVIRVEFNTRKVQEIITKDSGREWYVDDDEYWIYGMFYYNPNDNHTMINSRIGVNTTVNLAKPIGKILTIFGILTILLMPLIGAFTIVEEFTPLKVEYVADHLTVNHTKEVLSLDASEISEVELLDKLPQTSKTNGTAFTTLKKGIFQVNGIGSCKLYLNPKVGPFIKIKANEKYYIIGTNSSNETLEIYEDLKSMLKN